MQFIYKFIIITKISFVFLFFYKNRKPYYNKCITVWQILSFIFDKSIAYYQRDLPRVFKYSFRFTTPRIGIRLLHHPRLLTLLLILSEGIARSLHYFLRRVTGEEIGKWSVEYWKSQWGRIEEHVGILLHFYIAMFILLLVILCHWTQARVRI